MDDSQPLIKYHFARAFEEGYGRLSGEDRKHEYICSVVTVIGGHFALKLILYISDSLLEALWLRNFPPLFDSWTTVEQGQTQSRLARWRAKHKRVIWLSIFAMRFAAEIWKRLAAPIHLWQCVLLGMALLACGEMLLVGGFVAVHLVCSAADGMKAIFGWQAYTRPEHEAAPEPAPPTGTRVAECCSTVATFYQAISAEPAHQTQSFEELRLQMAREEQAAAARAAARGGRRPAAAQPESLSTQRFKAGICPPFTSVSSGPGSAACSWFRTRAFRESAFSNSTRSTDSPDLFWRSRSATVGPRGLLTGFYDGDGDELALVPVGRYFSEEQPQRRFT